MMMMMIAVTKNGTAPAAENGHRFGNPWPD